MQDFLLTSSYLSLRGLTVPNWGISSICHYFGDFDWLWWWLGGEMSGTGNANLAGNFIESLTNFFLEGHQYKLWCKDTVYALLYGIRLNPFIPVELSMSKYIQMGYGLLSISAQFWLLLCLVIIVFFFYIGSGIPLFNMYYHNIVSWLCQLHIETC